MGYLFAFLAVFCGAAKGFCGKKISGYTTELKSAALANFLRMMLCIAIGFLFVIFELGIGGFSVSPMALGISFVSGVSTSVFVISWLLAVRRGAYMMVDVFLAACVFIPMILSSIFYNEAIKWNDIVGVLLLLIATVIMCSYSSGIKQKISVGDILIMSLAGVANGVTSFSQKMFVNNSEGSGASVFNFYTYVFSALVLFVFFLITSKGKKQARKENSTENKFPLIFFIYILIMAVCLFANSFFNTLASGLLSASQLYPLSQGSALIISFAMAAIFFGEKVKLRSVVGVAVTFAGLLIINLL